MSNVSACYDAYGMKIRSQIILESDLSKALYRVAAWLAHQGLDLSVTDMSVRPVVDLDRIGYWEVIVYYDEITAEQERGNARD